MTDATKIPLEGTRTRCHEVRLKLGPLQKELVGLPTQRERAKLAGDIGEIRRLKTKSGEVHEQLLEIAGAAKQELAQYTDEVQAVINRLWPAADDRIAEAKRNHDVLQVEYEAKLKVARDEIADAERAKLELQHDVTAHNEMLAAINSELTEQIAESAEGI